MGIGPVSPVLPVTMIKPSSTAPDLSDVYEVEYLGQPGDDEYTPANRQAARGLEDEDGEAQPEPMEFETLMPSGPSRNVSFFA